jgi:hypothetical protein
MRRLAQAPLTPFIDGRKSVASRSRAHTNMRANPEGAEILRSDKQPAPSRHRSRLLSQTVCRLAQAPPTRFIDGRKSVASRAHTNMRATTEGAEIPRSGKCPPRRAIALRHFPRPCAGSRKHHRPPGRLSMVENRSRRASTPICVQIPRGIGHVHLAQSRPLTSRDERTVGAMTWDPAQQMNAGAI